jgi:hypothetical protein
MRVWQHIFIMVTVANLAGGQPAATNAPSAAPAKGLNVTGYHIEGNTVLPPENFGVLSN